jgi:hypothetical protein
MTVSAEKKARWLSDPKAKRVLLCNLHYLYAGSPCPSVNIGLLTEGGTAWASSTGPGNRGPAFAFDGDQMGQFTYTDGASHWGPARFDLASGPQDPTPTLYRHFGSIKTFNKVVLFGAQDSGNGTTTGPIITWTSVANEGTIAHDWAITDYHLQYRDTTVVGSPDAWVTFITVTGNTRVKRTHLPDDAEWSGADEISTDAVRLVCTAGTGIRPRVAELEFWTPDPLRGTLYFGEEPYYTGPGDDPASVTYHDCIAGVPTYTRSIDETQFTGPISVSVDDLVLDDPDGDLDALMTAVVDSQTCEFLLGDPEDPEWTIADFIPVFTAVMEKVEQTQMQKRVKLRAIDLLLDVRVSGTMLASGQRAPVAIGMIDFGEAVPEDTSINKHRFADPAFWYVPRWRTALQNMWDDGVSLNGVSFSPSAAAPTVTQYEYYDPVLNVRVSTNAVADTDGSTPSNFVTAAFPNSGYGFLAGVTFAVILWVPNGNSVQSVTGSGQITWAAASGFPATLGDGSLLYVYTGATTGASYGAVAFSAILAASTFCKIQTIGLDNTDNAGPHQAGSTAGSGATITSPSLTPSVTANMLRVDVFFSEALNPAGNSQPTGMTEVIEGYAFDPNSATAAMVMSVDVQTISTSSGVGTGTKISTNNNPSGSNLGVSLLFKGSPLSINTGTGTWTVKNHGFVEDDVVTIASTGTLPTTSPQIVKSSDNYSLAQMYVHVVDADNFKLYQQKGSVGLVTVSNATYSGTLTFTARRYWDNGDGSALLVDRPDGVVHAKFDNDQVSGYGGSDRANDFFYWAWNTAAAFAGANYSGAHSSYPRGDLDDAQLGGWWNEPTKVRDILDGIAFSSNASWGPTRLGEFMYCRIRTNPLLMNGSPTSPFDTPTQAFTDDDIVGGPEGGSQDAPVARAIPRYKTINAWVGMNHGPLASPAADVDAATAKLMRDKGRQIQSSAVADGTISESPARYHHMIDSEVFETMLADNATYYPQWADFKRDRLYPWLEYRTFRAFTDALERELADYVTADQPVFAHDGDVGDWQVLAITLKLSRADNYSVDLKLVRRRPSTAVLITQ